jgi:hypothetical protein
MTMVMSELQDRKVTPFFLGLIQFTDLLQVEGFKLHVTHNTKPFVNKIQYAPEVASKPERLEKDLANTKTLAALLGEEAAILRKAKKNHQRGSDAVEQRIEKVVRANQPPLCGVRYVVEGILEVPARR